MPRLDRDIGASSKYFKKDLAETAQEVIAGQSLLYSIHCLNTTAAAAYLQIFDALAASVTPGTTAPTLSFGMAANGTVSMNFRKPLLFNTGITVCSTTTVDGNTGAATVTILAYA